MKLRGVMLTGALLGAACAAQAGPAYVGSCDFAARADNIVEPWSENTATFANGAVRLALMDTIEPAAAAFHILVLSPPFDEVGGRQCRVISAAKDTGFGGVDFAALSASYDPATGLSLMLPVSTYDGTGDPMSHQLHMTLNQATGVIATEVAP
ncbi:hypothetical protein BMI91_11630 [Thioclava sediminum]|uniref:Uncharacterized protein n=1 Tax=Thioclava sediminum TaxID=1915319 RepID=A0ABX3MY82_9RHOB|nr:hypothetical protein [Thioclava sediminum]OOY24659.1 hypothetical protein BMI91_11630 [Thioclava sediminum]